MAYYPLLVRVNGNINEEDAIATGECIITLEEAPVDSETNEVVKEPFAAVQTLYYGENKYWDAIEKATKWPRTSR